MKLRRIALGLAVLATVWTVSAAGQDLKETYYNGFDDGKIDGPVGKAGNSVRFAAPGIVNMERGTIAFFYQSVAEPTASEWGGMGGLTSEFSTGYWGMLAMFQTRRMEFLFNFHDIGFYAPPLRFKPIIGRWKAGDWHHLAAVWDRNEGIAIYEDGKRADSLWGEYWWQWNTMPGTFSLSGLLDEVHIYATPLTDAQIAQLAKGEKPTGEPILVTPDEQRRDRELARMGWTGESLAAMPGLDPGVPLALTFTRVSSCVDAKRPVAYPHEGLLYTTWPSHKYGSSIRGQRLDIGLDDNGGFDRVRVLLHRAFEGEFVRVRDGQDEKILDVTGPHAAFRHAKLPALMTERELALRRAYGQLGQIDFYRAEAVDVADLPDRLAPFAFAKADAYPDGDLGDTFRSEIPLRHQQPVAGVRTPVAAWTLRTPAFGGFQVATDPLDDARAFNGAVVALKCEGIALATPVRVEIKEPVFSNRVWLAADVVLQPKGPGPQEYTLFLRGKPVINMPSVKARKYLKDGKYEEKATPVPGARFGLKVTAAEPITWRMGDGGTSVAFSVIDIEEALPTAVADQVEYMREAYAEGMEGHQYAVPRLVVPMKWLVLFAPENMKFRQMYGRLGSERAPPPQWFEGTENVLDFVYDEPKNETGAPEWAFWQKEAMDSHRDLVHWIIDNKQVWTGEFGGIWNDDSCHVENWMGFILCMDDSRKILHSLQRYWDGLWRYQLDDGVGKNVQDYSHFSEEGTSAVGMRVMAEYGDPIAYAHAMRSASHFDQWTVQREDGHYVWRSVFFSLNSVWSEGGLAPEGGVSWGGHAADPVVPAGYLVWYNRHPEARKWYNRFPAMGGFHGAAQARSDDWAAARARKRAVSEAPTDDDLGNPRYRRPVIVDFVSEFGVSDNMRKFVDTAFKPGKIMPHYQGWGYAEEQWLRWKASGDIRFLVDIYKRTCEWFPSHDWLNAGAMPSMDRNPFPRSALICSRMGARAAGRGSEGIVWPYFGISYPKGADDVAALVTENLDDKLQVRLYPFTEGPHEMQVRIWRLTGRFKVQLAHDRNDDGQPEEAIWEKEMDLIRGAPIDLTLPPKQCAILTISAIEVKEPDYDKPDPAISIHSIELAYGDHMVVRVYNNGTKPVDDVLVRVRDGLTGRVVVMGEKHTGPIEAPLDLVPRYKGVEFKNINCNTNGVIIIEIDPEREIDDLNPYNNSVHFRYQSTFTVDGGWE